MKSRKIALICVFVLVVTIVILTKISVKEEYDIHVIVREVLEADNLTNCKLVELGDYSNIHKYLTLPQVTQQDLEVEIKNILNKFGYTEITVEFVQENYDCDTIEQFYAKVENDLVIKEKVQSIIWARQEIINELIEISEFRLDEEQIVEFSLETVYAYETEAMLYNLSLEEYCDQILEISYDELFDRCYEESEKLIKTYLIIGAIAMLEKNLNDLPYENEEDIYMQYQNLENKIFSLFIDAEEGF